MKKKIILLLIFIVSFIGFGIEVRAVDDAHELFYSIDSVKYNSDNSKVIIKGWAFFHNYNQCGNGKCVYNNGDEYKFYRNNNVQDITKDFIYDLRNNGKGSDYYRYYAIYNDTGGFHDLSLLISINIRDSSYTNSNILYSSNCKDVSCSGGVVTLKYIPIDLFSWMCNQSEKYSTHCNGYVTNNVGFEAEIDLSKLVSGKNYYLFIKAQLSNGTSMEKGIGISNKVVDDIDKDNKHLLSNGSKLIFSNLSSGVQNGNNTGKGIKYSYNVSNKTFSQPNTSDYFSGNYTIDYVVPNDYNVDGKKFHSYFPPFYCFKDGSCGPSTWFVTENEHATITIEPPNDHVCNDSSGTIDACTGGSIENNCSKMTVRTTFEGQEISAVVSIKESSTISPGEDEDENFVDNYNSYFGIDYSKYNIVRGKTFHYALTYTNTASWSFVERDYDNVSEEEKQKRDAAIRKKMKSYYTEIGSKFSIESNDRKEFNTAGNWTCTGGTKNGFASGSTTLTCKYELKYLDIDGNGKDSYGKMRIANGVELTLGRNFYIPLDYDEDEFTWVVNGSDLTTVAVRTNSKDENETSSLLKVATDDKTCSINVVGPNFTPDTSGDPSYNPDTIYEDDKLYVYRSVSVDNPFPDGNIPGNWNNVNLINRLKNSYQNINNPDYETVPLTTSVVKQIRSLDTIYTKWDDTITSDADNSGNNSFIKNTNYFNIIRGKHCKFGLFDSNCDGRVG